MSNPLPFSPIRRAGDWVLLSGQVGLVEGALVDGVAAQTAAAIAGIYRLLEREGLTLAHIEKTTVYLVDMADYGAMNEAYAANLQAPYPTRSAVAVKELPLGARVEIEAWARFANSPTTV